MDVNFDVRNVLLHVSLIIGTKTTNKDISSANLVHIYNNVILIGEPKFYCRIAATVQILITNFRGSLFIGTPCTSWNNGVPLNSGLVKDY